MSRFILAVAAILAVMAAAGCGPDEQTAIGMGRFALTLPAPGSSAVGGFKIEVCKPDSNGTCVWPCPVGSSVDGKCVSLESENYPVGGVSPPVGHNFADSFFDVFAGLYCVQATPVTDCTNGFQVKECAVAHGGAYSVNPGLTTEVEIVSNCDRRDTGGLDVVVLLNNDPLIESLIYKPSKFVCIGEQLTVAVTAVDPDGDLLTWTINGNPPPPFCMVSQAPGSTQSVLVCTVVTPPPGPGTTWLTVMACDPYGMCAKRTFPIHVSDCPQAADSPDAGVADSK